MRTLLAALLAVLACVCAAAAPAPVLPRAQGYVNDFAGILDSAARENLTALLTRTERDTGAEIAVVTVESLDGMSVEEYASRLFAAWGIGKKGRDNGVLVLVAPNQRQMRIEVGYGLEPVLPDGLAGEIIRADFLPRFRENRYNDGIVAGVADLVAIVRRGEPASRSGRPDPPHSPLAMTLFFSLFVAAGAFAVGAGLT